MTLADYYLTVALFVWIIVSFSKDIPLVARFIVGFGIGLLWPFLLFRAALKGVK